MQVDDILYIEDADALAQLCQQLRKSPAVALDTEFTRDKTYYPRLGLIQIASSEVIACIDPLAISDATPLQELLQDRAITKIIHSARQDIEVLWQRYQVLPQPLFDSQLAAAFLGMQDQISYAALVDGLLNIKLPKTQTRTDWCQRPLTREQIQYAADDVRYLIRLQPLLRQSLQQKNRLAWFEDECQRQLQLATTDNSEQLWQQVGGCHLLNAAQAAILRVLTQWREQRAQQLDRPRKWILQDEILIALCMQTPSTLDDLRRINDMPPAVIERVGNDLLQLIQQAKALPESRWPTPTTRDTFTAQQKKALTELSAHVRERAQQIGIAASLLTTRKDLEKLIVGNRHISLLQGWRYELAGEALLAQCRTLLPDIVN